MLILEQTFWVPLQLSNEGLFTAPTRERFTVLCGTEKYQLTLQKRGKFYLPPRCKAYSTHSTLYALSTLMHNNSLDDVLPIASVDRDCCSLLTSVSSGAEVNGASLHFWHHFNNIIACLGYHSTVLQLNPTVNTNVAAASNKSASVVI